VDKVKAEWFYSPNPMMIPIYATRRRSV